MSLPSQAMDYVAVAPRTSINDHHHSSPILAHHGAGIVSNMCPCPTCPKSSNRNKSHEVDRLKKPYEPSTPGENPSRNPSKSQKNWLVVEPYPSEKYDESSVEMMTFPIYIYIYICGRKVIIHSMVPVTTNHQHPFNHSTP